MDLDTLVPKDHLLRKIEKVMDYNWLYEQLDPLYCHDNGRPGTDPVVLIKMVLIQHLFGIPSLRQTYREIQVNLAYRWFLGYGLLDEIPHFATVSYAFCRRFPENLTCEIFEHILNKALNNRMVDPSVVFIDGTHIKASANKKKFQKQKVAEAAKVYAGKLREEVNAEREKLGKKPIEDGDDDDDPKPPKGGKPKEKTVSTTDPDCGMFVKGEHERQFAYEAHTACDKNGFILGVEVTAGNVHDSVAWDKVYDEVTAKHDVKFVTMDAGYKTPWIAKKTFDDGRIPILPYTRPTRKRNGYKPWDYTYDPVKDNFICPQGQILRHTTTDRDGKRTYRSTPKNCTACPCKAWCGANEKGQKLLTTHIWQEYLDLAEEVRKNEYARMLYRQRKESIERVFADAKEKHAMRYTHHRGLAAVTRWVRLKYAAMNLKKLANWSWKNSLFLFIGIHFPHFYDKTPVFLKRKQGFFDRLKKEMPLLRHFFFMSIFNGKRLLPCGKGIFPGFYGHFLQSHLEFSKRIQRDHLRQVPHQEQISVPIVYPQKRRVSTGIQKPQVYHSPAFCGGLFLEGHQHPLAPVDSPLDAFADPGFVKIPAGEKDRQDIADDWNDVLMAVHRAQALKNLPRHPDMAMPKPRVISVHLLGQLHGCG